MNRAGAVMIGAVSSDLVRLRVSLRDVKPTPWRRIVVPTAIMRRPRVLRGSVVVFRP